jgi:hypothetical protein
MACAGDVPTLETLACSTGSGRRSPAPAVLSQRLVDVDVVRKLVEPHDE